MLFHDRKDRNSHDTHITTIYYFVGIIVTYFTIVITFLFINHRITHKAAATINTATANASKRATGSKRQSIQAILRGTAKTAINRANKLLSIDKTLEAAKSSRIRPCNL